MLVRISITKERVTDSTNMVLIKDEWKGGKLPINPDVTVFRKELEEVGAKRVRVESNQETLKAGLWISIPPDTWYLIPHTLNRILNSCSPCVGQNVG